MSEFVPDLFASLPSDQGNVQRFRGGLVCKAHRLRVSLNSRLENKKEEVPEGRTARRWCPGRGSAQGPHKNARSAYSKVRCTCALQGYLARKKPFPPRTLQWHYLGCYGGPWGGGMFAHVLYRGMINGQGEPRCLGPGQLRFEKVVCP